jgi:ferredoxin-NADP reductase
MAAKEARTFDSRLLHAADECLGVKTLRFETPPDFNFLPGMWVMVCFPDAPKECRAYSIATSPLEKGYVELSMARVGTLTSRLFALQPGQSVLMRGPYGRWTLDERSTHAVLISEGTGLTPFRSMCRYAIDRKLPLQLTILYSARTEEEQLYRLEYAQWRRHGIDVHASAAGRVDIAAIERKAPGLAADFYLCGDSSFIKDLAAALGRRSVPRERIRYEKWGDYSF